MQLMEWRDQFREKRSHQQVQDRKSDLEPRRAGVDFVAHMQIRYTDIHVDGVEIYQSNTDGTNYVCCISEWQPNSSERRVK